MWRVVIEDAGANGCWRREEITVPATFPIHARVAVISAVLFGAIAIAPTRAFGQAPSPAIPTSAAAQEYAIVDTDMGVLNDDAVAMFMLLNTPSVNLLGVTIGPGNSWTEHGTAAALRQLELTGHRNVPVVMGVHEPLMGSRQPWLEAEERLWGKSEFLGAYGRPRATSYLELDRAPAIGYPTTAPSDEHAVDFIIRSIKAHPNQVTLFVLGPATNIALAIRKNPEIVPLVKRVYYMGGAIDVPGNSTPAAEFNWWFDPEAIRIVLRAPFREQIVVPLDIAERVYYTKAEYDRIAAATETPLTKMFKQLHGPRFERDAASRSFVWDALTTAIYLQPAIATRLDDRYIDIDVTYGPNYGRSIGYHQSRRRSFETPADFPGGTQKVKVLMDIDRAAFWNLYVDLMTRRQ
jgi:inosine-uridine nucleoside N-ribohydrolase